MINTYSKPHIDTKYIPIPPPVLVGDYSPAGIERELARIKKFQRKERIKILAPPLLVWAVILISLTVVYAGFGRPGLLKIAMTIGPFGVINICLLSFWTYISIDYAKHW